mgnify:CR=1 FL=1|tara:strand:- start:33 stop:221 length:189 start_codon:yes stop_codon:yes gene_type:complete
MRYYWEALFSVEYFPYWEFSMLMMLCLQLSQLWRVHRIEKKVDEMQECQSDILFEIDEMESQ